MNEETDDTKIFSYQHNQTNEWVDNIFEQIINYRALSLERNQIIEIDHNISSISPEISEYLLTIVKKHINISSSSVSPNLLIFFSILYGFIFIFGILSNSIIIYSFYRSKSLRTLRNLFIVNLAISDILVCSICAPLTLFRFIDWNWKLGRVLCKLGPGLQIANVLVSALSITAIAVDRWNFIVHSGKTLKKAFLYIFIVLIWIISLLISIPGFIVTDEKIFRIKQTKEVLYKLCEETWFNYNSKYIYCTIVISVQYILPVIIVGSTNYTICNFLHLNVPQMFKKKQQSSHDTSKEINEISNTRNRRLLINYGRASFLIEKYIFNNERFSRSKKILFVVFITFSLCWLPVAILNFILDFSDFSNFLHNGSKIATLFLFAHSIGLSSSCLNPVIYGLLNKNFKNELVKILKPKSNLSRETLSKPEVVKETISLSNIVKNQKFVTTSNNTFI